MTAIATIIIDELKTECEGFDIVGLQHPEVDIVAKRVLTVSRPYESSRYIHDAWVSCKSLCQLLDGKALNCWNVDVTFDNQQKQSFVFYSLTRAQDAYAIIREMLDKA